MEVSAVYLLELKSINKKYENFEVLKDISLQIEKGEFVTIVGSSGSGKSTLLYIMGGLEYPSSGDVLFSGTDINKLSDRQKSKIRQCETGFVFQFYNLIQNLTVKENILLPSVMNGKKKDELAPMLSKLLQIVGLTEHVDKIPSQLSGGQQQRVAIARAVISNPKLVLADEPTGNLDSVSGTKVMELLSEINDKFGTAIVHVTHNKELIKYSNRVITVKDGQIVSDQKLNKNENYIENQV